MVTYTSKVFITAFSFFLTVATVWGLFQMFHGFVDLETCLISMACLALYTSSLVLVLIKHKLVSIFLRVCAAVFAVGSLRGTVELLKEGSPIALTLVMVVLFGMSVLSFLLVGRYVVRDDSTTEMQTSA